MLTVRASCGVVHTGKHVGAVDAAEPEGWPLGPPLLRFEPANRQRLLLHFRLPC